MATEDYTNYPLAGSSNFTVSLLTHDELFADPHTSHRVHKTVLLLLISISDGCWVYGKIDDSETWQSVSDILVPQRGKFKVRTTGDPISDREVFWNAHSGRRGTIVISVPIDKFSPEIFRNCKAAWVSNNFRAGHTPAAISFAKRAIEDQSHIIFCLPRNNGIEWMTVFPPIHLAQEFYNCAKATCGRKE
jgi:hypothetical protein